MVGEIPRRNKTNRLMLNVLSEGFLLIVMGFLHLKLIFPEFPSAKSHLVPCSQGFQQKCHHYCQWHLNIAYRLCLILCFLAINLSHCIRCIQLRTNLHWEGWKRVECLLVIWHASFSPLKPQRGSLSGGTVLPPDQWILLPGMGSYPGLSPQ